MLNAMGDMHAITRFYANLPTFTHVAGILRSHCVALVIYSWAAYNTGALFEFEVTELQSKNLKGVLPFSNHVPTFFCYE